ncbi:MAG: hypothetical protein JNK08_05220 [Sediminibacterium sp.]|nr:hypothetical protein [Sediminibacterium sp.]
MKCNTNNKRAIVAYLDYKNDQYAMFKIFLYSAELIDIVNTDIVIFYDPSYHEIFKNYSVPIVLGNKNSKLILIQMLSISISDSDFSEYLYINSIACLSNQHWLKRYDFILKTDIDIVLTDNWNNYYPTGFETGLGCYNHDNDTKQKLKQLADRLKLPLKQTYQYNIGSSWYGKSEDILNVASLTVLISRELLVTEFKKSTGEWPGFFKGVTSLYASEIAINYLIDNIIIKADHLDFPSDSTDNIVNHTHIHFVHCTDLFSKHAFLRGDYDDIDIARLNKSIVNEYCLYCALSS